MWQLWKVMARSSAMLRAMGLAVLVVLAGVGLLMLSGWFISAAALAGLAGYAGGAVMFDVFRPAAAVRGLALIRTAARYGERMLGHDATLRAVVDLRGAVLSGLSDLPWQRLLMLRRGPALARVIADTDRLDGLPLRLVLPGVAAAVVILLSLLVLGWLAGWVMALWICGCHLLASGLSGAWGFARSARLGGPLDDAESDFRSHALDLAAARDDLLVHGRIDAQIAQAMAAERRAGALADEIEATERAVVAVQELGRLAAMVGALVLGGRAVAQGALDPAIAAMCFFAALALSEAVAPLRRAVGDWGRIRQAMLRVAAVLEQPMPRVRENAGNPVPLVVDGVTVGPGEVLGITGPSGAGKSTLLAQIAGLIPPAGRGIILGVREVQNWPEDELRTVLTLVPQRTALVAGTLRENLALAAPGASEEELAGMLAAMRLDHLPGGLDMRLSDGGAPLSGGEARRVAIARALLKRPAILLLDEPTEGLEDALAAQIMTAIARYSCDVPLVVASHRRCDLALATQFIALD
ncbi:amino acid ABC transporter ATP-binding/permease protein [Paracoccus sp. NGMCC 1.201697]|uniref:Amino acid ABC transporter ATP-binding/permease protein n=1 Tax=Paracoccus broussonetiae subsp. drimophilus TaxID=3373869 RepID=A0ABW7LF08_9RHOB